MRKLLLGVSFAIFGAAVAVHAATPVETIDARHKSFKQIGGAMKAAMDELKKPDSSVATIRTSAATIATLAPQVSGWFPRGSGPEAGVKTKAKAEIWSDHAGFTTAAGNLVTASRAFKAAADSGDIAAIRAAAGNLGGACKGCHEKFRERD